MGSEQQFCLKWNNHQSTIVAGFDTLLESGTLVDCTLAAEGQYLKAHKVVLSACSPYFELLLSQHDEKHPIVILKDVKFQELKAMVDYMYHGEVNISQDQLGALLKAAESLQIKGLSDSGGGGSERENADKRHGTRKQTVPPPQPPRSSPIPPPSSLGHRRPLPQPQPPTVPPIVDLPEDDEPPPARPPPLPRVSSSREGSSSPPPKRKRHRRRSSGGEESLSAAPVVVPLTEGTHETSSSSELPPQSQPAPSATVPSIPSSITPVVPPSSEPAAVPSSQASEPVTETEMLNRTQQSEVASPRQPPHEMAHEPVLEPVQKVEPQSEVLLEPKSEYLEEDVNEDSVEDLTLDDDMDEMDQPRPGPSHGGEGSSSQGGGFAPWHVADQSRDEVFMAAQEAVGAHRDSQESDPLQLDSGLQEMKTTGISLVPTALLLRESALKMEPPFENSDTEPQSSSSLNEISNIISDESIPVSKDVSNSQILDLPGINRSSETPDLDDEETEMLTIKVEPDLFEECSTKSPKSPDQLLADAKLASQNSDAVPITNVSKIGVKTLSPLVLEKSKDILDKLLKTRSLTKTGQKKPILLKFGVDPSKSNLININKSPIVKLQSIPKVSTASASNVCSTSSAVHLREEIAKPPFSYQAPQTRSKKSGDGLPVTDESSKKETPDKPFVVKSIFRLFDDKITDQHYSEQQQGKISVSNASSSNSIIETSQKLSEGHSLLKRKNISSVTELESQVKNRNTPAITVLKSGVTRTCKIAERVSIGQSSAVTPPETMTRPKRLLVSRSCKVISNSDPLWTPSSSSDSVSTSSESDKKTVQLKGGSLAEGSELIKGPVHFMQKKGKLVNLKSSFTCSVCNTVLQDLKEYSNHLKYRCKKAIPLQISKKDL